MAIHPLPLFFFLSSALSLYSARRIWAFREIPIARTLAALFFCIAGWTLFDGLESLLTSLGPKVFCSQMTYLFVFLVLVLFFRFALEFTGHASWLTYPRLLAISAIPFLTILIVFTNSWHHLNWIRTAMVPGTTIVLYERGPWFWVQTAYAYALFSVTFGILIQGSLRQTSIFRVQALFVILAAFIPLLVSIAYVLRWGPYPFIDFTSISFLLTGCILNFVMIRFRFLDLIPVARHLLVEHMAEGVIVLDAKQRILDINPQARHLLGIPIGSLGAAGHGVMPDWISLEALISTQQNNEMQVTSPGPEERVLNLRCAPMFRPSGGRLGWLLLARDVTEGVRAERDLRLMNDSLESQIQLRMVEIKAEQERADAILRSMGDALATIDLGNRITYVNPILVEWTGYLMPDLMGQPISMLGLDLTEILAKRTLGQVGRGHGTITRRNGTTYPAALTVAPMQDHSGRLMGHVVSHTDRSRDLALEHARTRFINSISHELRTPVTNIDLYVQLLTKALSQNRTADMTRYIGTLNEQMQQLKLLMRDILIVAELDSKPSLDPDNQHQTLAPYPLFEEIQRRQQPIAHQKQLSITLHGAPSDTPSIYGQQERLLLALDEILKNAVTYTPVQGKIDLRIRVNMAKPPGEVGFEVKDTGCGLSEKDKNHAFDRFYRGEVADAGDIPGSGLGLSIAAAIAHSHNGRIDLAGAVGEGTCVTLWVPAVQPSSATGVDGATINSDPDDGRRRFMRISKPKHLSSADD